MIRLSVILIVCLSWINTSKANDIKNLQIEGMSLGDSLLNYFDENLIKKNQADVYQYIESKKFTMSGFYNERDNLNFSDYDGIQVHYKNNDQNYIINGLSGKIFGNYDKNFKECFSKQDEILSTLKKSFNELNNRSYYTVKHPADKAGKSEVRLVNLEFKNRTGKIVGTLSIECYQWHESTPYRNNLKVVINNTELNEWLK